MTEIPDLVQKYLTSNDSLARAELLQRNPDLKSFLERPETREAILGWLGSEEAWEPTRSSFVANCLEFLRAGAVPAEEQAVRAFLLHPDFGVRLRVYEFLLTLYYPERNRNAMFLLLHGMLADPSDRVRVSAVAYIQGVGATEELRSFLDRWLKLAPGQGWEKTESFEMVEKLLTGRQ